MTSQIQIQIRYLGMSDVARLPPATSTITVDARIATLDVGWADRVARYCAPGVWGTLADGRPWQCAERITVNGYDTDDEGLIAALRAAREAAAAVWLQDIAERPDAAAAVEHYRVEVLDRLDREYAEHAARWEKDAQAIAAKFHRVRVSIGEQTVPGKCCVRSTQGTLLGYAHIWDGQWLGTVERL